MISISGGFADVRVWYGGLVIMVYQRFCRLLFPSEVTPVWIEFVNDS